MASTMEPGERRTGGDRAGSTLSRVLVMRGSRASIVDLRRLYATNLNGARVVSLADVWVAAQLPGDLFALTFDFIDDGGSRASISGTPKLDNAAFVKGWLDLDTRELIWDEAAAVPSHWRVKGVSTILAEDTDAAGVDVLGVGRGP